MVAPLAVESGMTDTDSMLLIAGLFAVSVLAPQVLANVKDFVAIVIIVGRIVHSILFALAFVMI